LLCVAALCSNSRARHQRTEALSRLRRIFCCFVIICAAQENDVIDRLTSKIRHRADDFRQLCLTDGALYATISIGLTSSSIRLPISFSACFRSNELCRLSQGVGRNNALLRLPKGNGHCAGCIANIRCNALRLLHPTRAKNRSWNL